MIFINAITKIKKEVRQVIDKYTRIFVKIPFRNKADPQ